MATLTRRLAALELDRAFGFDSETPLVLVNAHARWSTWTEMEPDLSRLADPHDLRTWTRENAREDKNAVLGAIGRLGSVRRMDGGDEAAAMLLVWAIIPGAAVALNEITHPDAEPADMVGHLWEAARTCRPEIGTTTCPVAWEVIMKAKNALQTEYGVSSRTGQGPKAVRNATCLAPDKVSLVIDASATIFTADDTTTKADDLLDLLDEFETAGVLSASQRRILIDCALVADRLKTENEDARKDNGRGRQGLTAHPVATEVGRDWGISARTVQRRASASLDAISNYLQGNELQIG